MDRARPLFADLEIRILERQPEGYPVELTLDTGQEFPRGYLSPAILPWRRGARARRGRCTFICLVHQRYSCQASLGRRAPDLSAVPAPTSYR